MERRSSPAFVPSQIDEAKSLGADESFADDDQKQLEKLHDLDAVADTVGGPTAARALKALKPGGVFGTVARPACGCRAAQRKGRRHDGGPADASRLYELADDVARGEFTIPIAKTLPLDQIQEAHREAENHPNGKIVLKAA